MQHQDSTLSFNSGDEGGIDQKILSALYNFILHGSPAKFIKNLNTLTLPQQHIDLLRLHLGFDVTERANFPNPSVTVTANHILPYFGNQLVVRNPTLLTVAILHDQDAAINELVRIACNTCSGDIDTVKLLDSGEDVSEVNVRKQVEWRATGVTPLMIACMLDKQKIVERLLAAGCDPNAVNSLGRAALHEACFQGNAATAQMCILNGARVNCADQDGASPLMLSCARGSIALMKLLLSKGADTRQKDMLGRNALFYSLPTASVETSRQLIKADRNCYMRDGDGFGPFLSACKMERLDMVKFYIDEADTLALRYSTCKTDSIINERDRTGRNGLHIAAEIGSQALYNLLITTGISCEPDDEGRSPLMLACLGGSVDFVKFLIESNPGGVTDKLQRDDKGRNAVYYAVTSGSTAIIDYLATEQGVPVESTPSGLTPLMQAAGKGKPEVVKYLLQKQEKFGINVNACDVDSWDAAMYAASVGDLSSLEQLIEAGIELHLTADGRTILMESALHGSVDTTGFIIDVMRTRCSPPNNEPDLFNHCDNEGWNAAMYALVATDPNSSIRLLQLLESSANVKPVATKNGVTPLMQAAMKGSVIVTNFLLEKRDEYSLDLLAVDNEGANALNYAAVGGSITVFNALFASGVPCIGDKAGRTVLMSAAARGHVDLVNHLVKNATKFQLDLWARDTAGRNALFHACSCGAPAVVGALVNSGIDIASDDAGVTILMATAEYGNLDLVNWLLREFPAGCTLNELDREGRNVFFYAFKSLNVDMIDRFAFEQNLTSQLAEIPIEAWPIVCKITNRLLRAQNDDENLLLDKFLSNFASPTLPLNVVDESGQSPLYYLVADGKLDLFDKYAAFYDATTAKTTRHGVTLLMHACASSLVDVVRKLLNKVPPQRMRCLLDAEDSQGRTALTYAVVSHNAAIVRLLVERSARIHVDKNGHCAITYAVQARNLQLSLLLLHSSLEIGGDVGKTRDVEGNQLLHHCARHGGSEELVKLVLKRTGAEVNARTASGGRTALMLAVVNNNLLVVKALLKAGCSVTACDADGKTALHLLFENASKVTESKISSSRRRLRHRRHLVLTLTKLLISSPSSSYSLLAERDKSGRTALMLACIGGQIEAAFLMLERGAQLDVKDSDGKDALEHCLQQANEAQNEQDQQFFNAFAQFLRFVKEPSPAAGKVIEAFKEDILDALTANDDDEQQQQDENNSDENKLQSPADLISKACNCSLGSNNNKNNNNKSPSRRHGPNFIAEEAGFLQICDALTAADLSGVSATLRSELYKNQFSHEYFV